MLAIPVTLIVWRQMMRALGETSANRACHIKVDLLVPRDHREVVDCRYSFEMKESCVASRAARWRSDALAGQHDALEAEANEAQQALNICRGCAASSANPCCGDSAQGGS